MFALMISVVIIAKNEAANIIACVQSALQVSNDVCVIDSGSTDDTKQLAIKAGAIVKEVEWMGFGKTRNEGASFAKNNWVLSLDCDERISPEMTVHIKQLQLQDESMVYAFKRQNYLGDTPIYFGEWGRDTVNRLYNKIQTQWTDVPVHETLIATTTQLVKGKLIHYTYKSKAAFAQKVERYAILYAQRFKQQNKSASFIKLYLSPLFSFIQNYIFRLGFLDGTAGFTVAWLNAKYVQLKYKKLKELQSL
jgi:glycosyltransferase involved in cell wall biosynthesis